MIVALAIAAIASITILMVVAIVIAERAKTADMDRYTQVLKARIAASARAHRQPQQPRPQAKPQGPSSSAYDGGF